LGDVTPALPDGVDMMCYVLAFGEVSKIKVNACPVLGEDFLCLIFSFPFGNMADASLDALLVP